MANRTVHGHQGVGPSSERATERHLNWFSAMKEHVLDTYGPKICYCYSIYLEKRSIYMLYYIMDITGFASRDI